MPTWYTEPVMNGKMTSAKDYILRCAREIDYLSFMRDEPEDTPIPETRPEDNYYQDVYNKAKKELSELLAMDENDIHREAKKWRQDKIKTQKEFINEEFCSYNIFRDKNDTDCVFALPFKQAWSIRQQDWIDIAKNYNLEIKIFGIESGTGFWCSLHILKDGVIVENNFLQYQDYKDYVWNCPLPWMGG